MLFDSRCASLSFFFHRFKRIGLATMMYHHNSPNLLLRCDSGVIVIKNLRPGNVLPGATVGAKMFW
jgi:hypothetical protein